MKLKIRYETEPDIDPTIDFAANPEAVRTSVEGIRLSYGHLFNSTFATEISRIEPLPHQGIAVYDHMLKQNRLRFLLADDAGAGKTIMTGLYLREMLTRRLISRVLIVPPAGLVGNWEHEMRNLFNLACGDSWSLIHWQQSMHSMPIRKRLAASILFVVLRKN